jgi:hypothetical protein
MTLIKNLLIFLLAFSSFSAYANWVGKWESKGSDVVIGLSSEPNNPQVAKNSLLVIGYSKKHDCKPVVSVLVIKGQNIGQPINQKTSKSKKNQLIVKVGGHEFTEETKLTEYTSAVEFAMKGSQALVNALSNPSVPFNARIGSTILVEFASASEFANANRVARQNCR